MDCSEINLKLTKDNFNPQTLANYITKHKDTILANYSEKYLDCLDVTLDIANQTISYDIETFNQKIYVAKKPTKHNIHHHKH